MRMLVGVVGTNGAGKTTVVEILEKEGFARVSLSDLLRAHARSRELSEDRDTLFAIGNELRLRFGPSAVMEEALNHAKDEHGDVVFDSIRTLAEVALLRTQPNAIMLGVDADPKLRFARIMRRQQEGTRLEGITTFEQFLAAEGREHTHDPFRPQLSKVLATADTAIRNDGTRKQLAQDVHDVIARLRKGAPASSGSTRRR
jgi:dephospho-CoA kinase